MTADAATAGIREIDAGGTIGLISTEPDGPYDRPPLTKGLWKGQAFDTIWRHTGERQVDFHLGRKVESIDLPPQIWVRAPSHQGPCAEFRSVPLVGGFRRAWDRATAVNSLDDGCAELTG